MLEHGKPGPMFTVARELGHTSTRLIDERYGHLHRNPNERCRTDEMSLGVGDYVEGMGEEMVQALRAVGARERESFVTTPGTVGRNGPD